MRLERLCPGEAELPPDGPAVLEEYLYRDLAPNLGLTAADFTPGATPEVRGEREREL